MRGSVSSTREPMKPESRPSSEQGLASAVNVSTLCQRQGKRTGVKRMLHRAYSGGDYLHGDLSPHAMNNA
jgi:hypothetical protein